MSKKLIRTVSSSALPIKQDAGKVARSPPEKPVNRFGAAEVANAVGADTARSWKLLE